MSVAESPSMTASKGLSFRSFLPFSKTTPVKTPALNFGSFRRSTSVARRLPSPEHQILDIKQDRRSLSLSDLQKPLPEPSEEPIDLSTIIEAETSGLSLSKHIPSPSPSPSPIPDSNDSSALDLSTTRLDAEVLDAMIAKDYATAGAWSADVKVIDVSSDSLDIDNLDPELTKLLSPNNLSQKTKLVDMTIQPARLASPVPSTSSSPLRPKFSIRSRKSSAEESVRHAPPSPSPLRTGTPPSKGKERERVFIPPSRSSLDFRRPSPSSDARVFVDTVPIPKSNSTPALAIRRRKRSMSVEYASPNSTHTYNTSRFNSVRVRHSPNEETERPSTSTSRKVEMGPRTIRAFKAAGLLADDSPTSELVPRGSLDLHRRAPSRIRSDIGFSDSPLLSGRHSRMTHSDWRSPSVMDSISPTTHSSRDTPSTAPTSVTSTSHSRDRDFQWLKDELEALKDRHSTESAALLAALSDSQRTTRLLREENQELRERLAFIEREFEERRQAESSEFMERLRELETENDHLRRLVTEQSQTQTQIQIRPLQPRSSRTQRQSSRRGPDQILPEFHFPPDLDLEIPSLSTGITLTSTPAPSSRRRLSTSSRASSVFQIPPPDMTLLLHDDGVNFDSDRSGVSTSPEEPTVSLARSLRLLHAESLTAPLPITTQQRHKANKSISSMNSVVTRSSRGSPKSLFPLRPEDEIHLGDLGSLSLNEESEGSVF